MHGQWNAFLRSFYNLADIVKCNRFEVFDYGWLPKLHNLLVIFSAQKFILHISLVTIWPMAFVSSDKCLLCIFFYITWFCLEQRQWMAIKRSPKHIHTHPHTLEVEHTYSFELWLYLKYPVRKCIGSFSSIL